MTDAIDDDEDFEELYGAWEPTLYAAVMADDRYFALLLGGPRWDDPYTIILTRDVKAQTFSRLDVRRELRDIRVVPQPDGAGEPSYVTLSLNGDIYVISPNGAEHSIIPGTQAESDDAPEILFSSILPVEDQWLVAGGDGFLKLGKEKSWQDVSPPLQTEYPYKAPDWTIIGANRAGDIFIVGTQTVNTRHFNLYPGHPLYRKDMPDEERFELKKKLYAEMDSYPRLKTLFTGQPESWTQQKLPDRIARSLPAYSYVADVESDGSDADYVIGSDGLVMKGNPQAGFSDISSIADREKNFKDGARLRNDLILATGTELFRFDGHVAKPFAPKVKMRSAPFVLQPSAIFVHNEKLYVFDYGLRYYILDDEGWHQYDIPKELSARPFKGGVKVAP
ncbi:hypothetical protein ATY76_06350 [Rhizobium sp. R339]|uniref:hypothetical protein n=1 Tax=Rhizobium sp. R339 TaxID=1764273 RepID=UPI000B52E981|nr:hypothetical protein [Rhizobium sp. R339]OWV72443.1 hypothetical protein ATY76_06350 [Rhizobium sp. R339]